MAATKGRPKKATAKKATVKKQPAKRRGRPPKNPQPVIEEPDMDDEDDFDDDNDPSMMVDEEDDIEPDVPSEEELLSGVDEESRMQNEAAATILRRRAEGKRGVSWKGQNHQKYNTVAQECITKFGGESEVEITRVHPTAAHIGIYPLSQIPRWSAVAELVQRNHWNGDSQKYKVQIMSTGRTVAAVCHLTFDESIRRKYEYNQMMKSFQKGDAQPQGGGNGQSRSWPEQQRQPTQQAEPWQYPDRQGQQPHQQNEPWQYPDRQGQQPHQQNEPWQYPDRQGQQPWQQQQMGQPYQPQQPPGPWNGQPPGSTGPSWPQQPSDPFSPPGQQQMPPWGHQGQMPGQFGMPGMPPMPGAPGMGMGGWPPQPQPPWQRQQPEPEMDDEDDDDSDDDSEDMFSPSMIQQTQPPDPRIGQMEKMVRGLSKEIRRMAVRNQQRMQQPPADMQSYYQQMQMWQMLQAMNQSLQGVQSQLEEAKRQQAQPPQPQQSDHQVMTMPEVLAMVEANVAEALKRERAEQQEREARMPLPNPAQLPPGFGGMPMPQMPQATQSAKQDDDFEKSMERMIRLKRMMNEFSPPAPVQQQQPQPPLWMQQMPGMMANAAVQAQGEQKDEGPFKVFDMGPFRYVTDQKGKPVDFFTMMFANADNVKGWIEPALQAVKEMRDQMQDVRRQQQTGELVEMMQGMHHQMQQNQAINEQQIAYLNQRLAPSPETIEAMQAGMVETPQMVQPAPAPVMTNPTVQPGPPQPSAIPSRKSPPKGILDGLAHAQRALQTSSQK